MTLAEGERRPRRWPALAVLEDKPLDGRLNDPPQGPTGRSLPGLPGVRPPTSETSQGDE